ncbi:hypothetical protein BGW42_004328 [Actinomortierella wolfii]|nr:hypothetical protein BGW42_004328 [Actinomortierella wolfii]
MLHPKRWTWDWSFPVLRILNLWGDLHEFKFNLAILRSCPNLREISILHNCSSDRFPLRVKGILDASLDKNNNHLSSFTHIDLLNIEIRGHWDIEVDELACLLQVLPGLKKLAFESAQFDEGFGDQELIEMTKTHPSLRYLFPDIKLTNVDPSTLDLSIEFRNQLQREMLLLDRVIDGENDIASLPERTRIIYGFGYPACLYYILHL